MFPKFFTSIMMPALMMITVFLTYPSKNATSIVHSEIEVPEFSVYVSIPIPEPIININRNPFNITRISAYNPVPRQTQGNPNVSSCGPNLERQIAVSRDLFFDEQGRKHLCGTRVTVVTDRGEVFADYVIWDTMNPRFRNTVDIMLPHTNEAEAFAFGVTSGVVYFHVD
jgi:hypothetical protein